MDNAISNIQRMILGIMRQCEYQTYLDLYVNLDICVNKTEIKRAMEGLIQRGLVECRIGLKYDDGKFAGSGFFLKPDKFDEVDALIK